MQLAKNGTPMTGLKSVLAGLALVFGMAATAAPVIAQGSFSPKITVNDRTITGYELEQRQRFLQLLSAPGNLAELARTQLIEDRLKMGAASRAGIVVAEQDVVAGMEEFAARANLSREEFVKALEARGVAAETFRDFVASGVAWRVVVQQRFGNRVQITDDQVDRALNASGSGSNVRVLLSEIIMPAPPPQADAVRARAERIAQVRSVAAFSAQARKYSATPSRGNGGKLPWQNLADLPPGLAALVIGLAPGEVTAPIPIPNAVALFQMRDIQETAYSKPGFAAIEYATYQIAGGRTPEVLKKAQTLGKKLDRCDDLYGVAKGQPAEVLTRQTQKPGEIPTDIAIELSKLDPGEVSTVLTRNGGQTLLLVMLCGRTAAISENTNREEVGLGLRNRRLQAFADGYLAELKAGARIINR